ncbi:MAG TPA: metal-dependent transcriptional regulator [Abditibacteriaceae bacterium]|jgi:DtxR family Mn-dependent transcriptional regulator
MDKALSSTVEDYLKTIYYLREEADAVTTQAVAARLNVAAPSATAMFKKLASLKLIGHTPYHGVELTLAGEKIALEVIRHHRLIETYLAQALGVEWDKVHEEAERWEHVLGEEVEAKMAAALGNPTHDPHGAPIPTLEGKIAQDESQPLSEVSVGTRVVVRRVRDEDAELLRYLYRMGLVPKAEAEVLRSVPAEGVLEVRVNSKRHTIGLGPAQAVFVSVVGHKLK